MTAGTACVWNQRAAPRSGSPKTTLAGNRILATPLAILPGVSGRSSHLQERNMNTHRKIGAVAVAAVMATGAVVACNDGDSNGPSIRTATYVATMSGANEVPPVAGGASGTATFTLTRDQAYSPGKGLRNPRSMRT